MRLIHISPVFNRDSITKNGLMPTKVKMDNHLDYFREHNLCTEDGRAIYTWIDSEKNEKFIKDMIYCITWIHPRNSMYCEGGPPEIDFRKMHRNPIYKWNEMLFDIYCIDDEEPPFNMFHVQEPSTEIYNTLYNMHEEYAHNDKDLCVLKAPTKAKVVGQAKYSFDNNVNIKIIK